MLPDSTVHVFINKQKHALSSPSQTGASLKTLAGIPLGDALFLQQPGEDLVIANDCSVVLKNGDQFHSQPPADYGLRAAPTSAVLSEAGIDPASAEVHVGPEGWSFVVLSEYELPDAYTPKRVRLLVKLAPTFPDAAPDMFWVYPAVRCQNGTMPRATSSEYLLSEEWQRFSWHLASGAWQPSMSTLRDFLRCVAARFQRLD